MKRVFSRPSNAGFHDAVVKDHAAENGCDSTCDITAALRAGYPRVAAYLLTSATEAPTVELVARSAGEDFGNFGHSTASDPDWLAWCEWFATNTVGCSSCDAVNFSDRGPVYTCGSCSQVLSHYVAEEAEAGLEAER